MVNEIYYANHVTMNTNYSYFWYCNETTTYVPYNNGFGDSNDNSQCCKLEFFVIAQYFKNHSNRSKTRLITFEKYYMTGPFPSNPQFVLIISRIERYYAFKCLAQGLVNTSTEHVGGYESKVPRSSSNNAFRITRIFCRKYYKYFII